MKFKIGDTVRKTKGSQWHGRVVGTYSTELTPEGYAVESSTERGSVQIYPAAALELAEPVAKPVAYRYKYLNFMGDEVWSQDMPRNGRVLETQALYTSPPPPAEVRPARPGVFGYLDEQVRKDMAGFYEALDRPQPPTPAEPTSEAGA